MHAAHFLFSAAQFCWSGSMMVGSLPQVSCRLSPSLSCKGQHIQHRQAQAVSRICCMKALRLCPSTSVRSFCKQWVDKRIGCSRDAWCIEFSVQREEGTHGDVALRYCCKQMHGGLDANAHSSMRSLWNIGHTVHCTACPVSSALVPFDICHSCY